MNAAARKNGVAAQSTKVRKPFHQRWLAQWDIQLMVMPAIIHILIFSYIPIYGILMAFQEFQLGDFPGFSQWVGFKQFVAIFTTQQFPSVLRNTFMISLLKLVINFPLPIFFALFMNEMRGKWFKKTMQTISYLPHFISWVVGARLMMDFLSTDGGAINEALMAIGLTSEPIGFFSRGEYFWGIAVVTDLWKELGWNSIIFYAAIASLDVEMYEAADIDGANRMQKLWYITLASIRPTIILLFIFTVGRLMNGNFDQIMMLTNQMNNGMLRDYADFLATYTFRMGVAQARFSFAAAVGLLTSIVNFILLLTVNKLADKIGDESVL